MEIVQDMRYEITDTNNHVMCKLITDAGEICKCEISVNPSICEWNITSWFTESGFKGKGFGKATMKRTLEYCIAEYGIPADIQYTWNGANAYVLEWLENNFDAVCTCPIAIQKTEAGDTWDSHIYELNLKKVLRKFEISEMSRG